MHEEDKVLIKLCLEGRVHAFTTLLNKYKNSIYNFVYRMIPDREQAKDITQEVFIKIFNSIHNYNPQYTFTSWLYKIAANLCIDYLRKPTMKTIQYDQLIIKPELHTHKNLEDIDKKDMIEKVLALLPYDYRVVIVLRHIENQSYEEIAKILNLPIGTVKIRIHRARELFKAKWEELETIIT